ncbi:hypothetical protein KP509_02G018400 [Ceratopteris richardii]|uniref:FAS1 domain-containing protein n=1 Tax=Ceratopteris richardii TaxID=49495 RepID=A0A8T2V3M9_CERRI|nr:hypothetical protein KP509_02G018400 [Ceratopteris richardii]
MLSSVIDRLPMRAAIILALIICSISTSEAQTVQREVFDSMIAALKGKGYDTGAVLLAFLQRFLVPQLTLLIPTDQAIATRRVQESQLYRIAQFHMIRNNLSFADLQVLPAGTFLPTLLRDARVEVVNNSAGNFTINNAKIIDPDLCPQSVSRFIACHGISEVLNPQAITSESFGPESPIGPLQDMVPSASPVPSPSPGDDQPESLPLTSPGGSSGSSALRARSLNIWHLILSIMCSSMITALKWVL